MSSWHTGDSVTSPKHEGEDSTTTVNTLPGASPGASPCRPADNGGTRLEPQTHQSRLQYGQGDKIQTVCLKKVRQTACKATSISLDVVGPRRSSQRPAVARNLLLRILDNCLHKSLGGGHQDYSAPSPLHEHQMERGAAGWQTHLTRYGKCLWRPMVNDRAEDAHKLPTTTGSITSSEFFSKANRTS